MRGDVSMHLHREILQLPIFESASQVSWTNWFLALSNGIGSISDTRQHPSNVQPINRVCHSITWHYTRPILLLSLFASLVSWDVLSQWPWRVCVCVCNWIVICFFVLKNVWFAPTRNCMFFPHIFFYSSNVGHVFHVALHWASQADWERERKRAQLNRRRAYPFSLTNRSARVATEKQQRNRRWRIQHNGTPAMTGKMKRGSSHSIPLHIRDGIAVPLFAVPRVCIIKCAHFYSLEHNAAKWR